jgi:hypothetical protein
MAVSYTREITREDWERAKKKSLVDIITADAGSPKTKSSKYFHFMCPAHGDKKTPSLVVNTEANTWRCYGGCKAGGDVFDWFRHYHNSTNTETLEAILGERLLETVSRPRIEVAPVRARTVEIVQHPKVHKTWSLDELEKRTRQNPVATELYFMSRGVARETVHDPRYLLGQENMLRTPNVRDWYWNGGTVTRPHFTIPYIQGDVVKAVKCRRDDKSCREALATLPDNLFSTVLEVLNDTYGAENVDTGDILDAVFGGRFSHWTGGNGHLPFNSQVVCKVGENGDIEPLDLPYIILNEHEIDTLYLRDALGEEGGYPAIAIHAVSASFDLKKALSKIRRIIYIEDNDQNNSGSNIAAGVIKALGRGERIRPPVGKDTNDVPASRIRGWLAEYGLEPLPRNAI